MIGFNALGQLGRLGNQMFQFAALKGIARHHDYQFCFPPSANKNEIPVGCVIFDKKGKIISSASNSSIEKNDPTAHAEILAIRKACKKLNLNKLNELSIFVTLEPCKMCEYAIYESGIKKIFFGAYSESSSLTHKKINYQLENNGYQFYGGIEEKECSKLLTDFFKKLR